MAFQSQQSLFLSLYLIRQLTELATLASNVFLSVTDEAFAVMQLLKY